MAGRRGATATLVANSVLGFALGTVVAFLVYELGMVAAGALAGRDPIWFHDRVVFTAPGSEAAWAGGTILVLAVGLALASIYRGGFRYDANRLAVLWITLHCLREGFVRLVRVPFQAEADVARAVSSIEFGWLLAVFGGAGLLAAGLLAAPALLRYAPDRSQLGSGRARLVFLALTALVPWVAGALLALPFFLPATGAGVSGALPLAGVFVVATLLAAPEPRDIEPAAETVRFSWGMVVLIIVLFALSRALLVDGLAVAL